MTEIEEAFHNAFKNQGGIYRSEDFDHPAFQHIRNIGNSIVSLHRGVNAKIPPIHVDIINNERLNASVTKSNGMYFIGINLGTIALILDVFFRMLCSKNVLVEVGDIAIENESKKIYNVELMSLDQLILAKEPDESLVPNSEEREFFANIFVDTLFEYLILHELGHIVYGHIDLAAKDLGMLTIQEAVNYECNLEGDNALFSQTLELDADSFATNQSLALLNMRLHDPKTRFYNTEKFYANWPVMLRYWSFGIYTFFRKLGGGNKLETMKIASHPSPSIRAHLVMANIYSIFQIKYDQTLLEKIPGICTQSMLEVEKAFVEISEQEYDLSSLSFSRTQEGMEHSKSIMKNWNNVRPRLERYAYSKLCPLYVDD